MSEQTTKDWLKSEEARGIVSAKLVLSTEGGPRIPDVICRALADALPETREPVVVTEEAVERAAKHEWERDRLTDPSESRSDYAKPWEEAPDHIRDEWRSDARATLEAALDSTSQSPHISDEEIAERRSDPEFHARLERSIEENRELLERLERPSIPTCETCGGGGRIKEARRALVTEQWYDADLGPCPDCSTSQSPVEEGPRCGGKPGAPKLVEIHGVDEPWPPQVRCPGCKDCSPDAALLAAVEAAFKEEVTDA